MLAAILTTTPAAHSTSTPIDSGLEATFSSTLSASSIDDRSFVVHGGSTGQLLAAHGNTTSLTASGETIAFQGASPFFPGEAVTAIATAEIVNEAFAEVDPYVWQFRVAAGTGPAEFVRTGEALPGSHISDVELADLDRDGDLDAFVTQKAIESAKVWLNDGRGIFTDSGQSFGDRQSTNVALGDLDGDGDIDAVVADEALATQVWYNSGDGTFANSGQDLPSAIGGDVVLGDIDGDGDLDVFVARPGNAPNYVLRNDGLGIFTDDGQSLGSSDTRAAWLGDVDNDGDLDAFTANEAQANRVWINDGTGVFSDSFQELGDSKSRSVAMGDLDGDGDLDAIVANASSNADQVWVNDGTGIFHPDQRAGEQFGSNDIQLGDLDGDGDLDAFTNLIFSHARTVVWINNGRAVFTLQSGVRDAGSGRAAMGDLDGDGDLDLFLSETSNNHVRLNAHVDLTASISSGSVAVSEGDAIQYTIVIANEGDLDVNGARVRDVFPHTLKNATWTATISGAGQGNLSGVGDIDEVVDLSIGSAITYLVDAEVASSLDGRQAGVRLAQNVVSVTAPEDGVPETNQANNRAVDSNLVMLRNISAGGVFLDAGEVMVDALVADIALGDVDGDNDLDAFVASALSNSVWLNNGAGTFVDSGQVLGNSRSNGATLGDLDGDGDLDAFVSNDGADPSEIWINDGQGFFSDSGQTLEGDHQAAVLGDLDGDGDLDAVVRSGINEEDEVWKNHGNGLFFKAQGVFHRPRNSASVTLGDLDGDGDLDLLAGRSSSSPPYNTMVAWMNDGTGDFSEGPPTPDWQGVRAALGDVDDDGDLDALVSDGVVSQVWLNDGLGTLTNDGRQLLAHLRDGALADFDGDGDLDLFLTSHTAARFWTNDGAGRFLNNGQPVSAASTSESRVGDLDGDGDLDVLQIDPTSRSARLYKNEAPDADLSVSLSGEQVLLAAGSLATFEFVVQNAGPSQVDGANVVATFSELLADIEWTAQPAGGASGVTAGNGAIDEFVNLPASGSITYTVRGIVSLDETPMDLVEATLTNTLRVLAPTGILETNHANNVAANVDLLAPVRNPSRGWLRVSDQQLPEPGEATGAALGDLDGDGDLDAFVATSSLRPHRIWINNGTGRFDVRDTMTGIFASGEGSVLLNDVDGDGDLDALVIGAFRSAALYKNDGRANFTPHPFPQTIAYDGQTATMGDVDGDGDLDLFLATLGGTSVYTNDYDNGFRFFQKLSDAKARDIALGDLDGDGDLDAVIAAYDVESRIWINDGTGWFGDYVPLFPGTNAKTVALGDLDGDGDLDLVTDRYGVWLNQGNAQFSSFGQVMDSRPLQDVLLGDMDGDGDLDILFPKSPGSEIWLNNGDAVFTNSRQSIGDGDYRQLNLGDLDGDGDLDVFGTGLGLWSDENQVWFNDDPQPNFDGDEVVGGADFLIWQRGLAETPPEMDSVEGDADNDGDVDQGDLTAWQQLFGTVVVQPDADFSGNGLVDGRDLLLWQRGVGLAAAGAVHFDGDADDDGDVDQLDLFIWRETFGAPVTPISNSSLATGRTDTIRRLTELFQEEAASRRPQIAAFEGSPYVNAELPDDRQGELLR